MRLSAKEFVLQFPDHPVSVELVQTGQVKLTGKEKIGAEVAFKKTRQSHRKVARAAKKRAVPTADSALEQLFLLHLKAEQLTQGLEREYQFELARKWRMDFAWTENLVAVEIEGGVWTQGRHTRPQGFINDTEKYNHAALLGWTVLRFTEQCIKNGTAIQSVKHILTTPT